MTELRTFDGATPWTDDADPANRDRLNAVKNHGGIGVSVYIRGTPGGMRHANQRDVNAALDLGLGVMPNWESTADFFRTATLADCVGVADEALAAARALNFPDDGTVQIKFSFDYEVPDAQIPRARDQLAKIQDRLGGTYVATAYAQSGLIKYLHGHGFGDRGHWLMASTFGLPYDIGQPGVAAVQSHHADGSWFTSPVQGTDVSVVTQVDKLGALWPANSPFGADMPLSATDAELVVDHLMHRVLVKDGSVTVADALRQIRVQSDPAKIAAAVAAKLPAGTANTAAIEAALRAVFADAGKA